MQIYLILLCCRIHWDQFQISWYPIREIWWRWLVSRKFDPFYWTAQGSDVLKKLVQVMPMKPQSFNSHLSFYIPQPNRFVAAWANQNLIFIRKYQARDWLVMAFEGDKVFWFHLVSREFHWAFSKVAFTRAFFANRTEKIQLFQSFQIIIVNRTKSS